MPFSPQALDVVGITLLHRRHVEKVDGSTVEFTDHGARELLIVPKTQAAEHEAKHGKHGFTTKTVWSFGEGMGDNVCHHCRHCTHSGR